MNLQYCAQSKQEIVHTDYLGLSKKKKIEKTHTYHAVIEIGVKSNIHHTDFSQGNGNSEFKLLYLSQEIKLVKETQKYRLVWTQSSLSVFHEQIEKET